MCNSTATLPLKQISQSLSRSSTCTLSELRSDFSNKVMVVCLALFLGASGSLVICLCYIYDHLHIIYCISRGVFYTRSQAAVSAILLYLPPHFY